MNEGIVANLRREADKWEKNHPIIGVGELRVHEALRDAARCIEDTSAKVLEWISVEDRLPEHKTTVLTFNRYNVRTLTYFYDHFYDYDREGEPYRADVGVPVTHWMPLPAAP